MSQVRKHIFTILILSGGLLVLLVGCSDKNSQTNFDSATGKHVENWIVDHGPQYLDGRGQCTECHGSDLRGGISNVSCYSASFDGISCHPGGPPGHPLPWANPDLHGPGAKAAPGSRAGFLYCENCHGNDFTGGTSNVTCLNTAACHGTGVFSPHSPFPWTITLGSARTHTTTDPGNGPVCGDCHRTAPPGPPSGCFNNTLCHGVPFPASHNAGTWTTPSGHGAAAKGAPGVITGFAYCQECHGNDFTGGVSGKSCLNDALCHGSGVLSPHSPAPWRDGTTHTSTNQGNASVCFLCHKTGNQGTPGCFNNTLCHGSEN